MAIDTTPATTTYADLYRRSVTDPEGFWGEAARSIHWHTPYSSVLDCSEAPTGRWFVGGELNTCYNAVDRHVEAGHGERLALIYDSPVTQTVKTYSYLDLQDRVARVAGMLAGAGVSRGDRVVIYMPMIPEAVFAMLACARLGAIHSVVFGGFAAHELAVRIDDATPKVVMTASCGIEPNRIVPYKPLLDAAIDQARHKPSRCFIYQRPQSVAELMAQRDADWEAALAAAQPHPSVPLAATDPLYNLYTSRTTGAPKGVVRDNGGHAVALHWTMKHIYNTEPGEVFWAASDVGWVVGHSYIVYGPLLHGNATLVYEGKPVGTPDPGAFWRVIEQHQVRVLFTAPTALRAIKKEDYQASHLARYNTESLRTLFLAGERCDPDTLLWAGKTLQVPVVDHWWQTETGWAICANCTGVETLPVKPGSPARPAPGYDVRVLDDEQQEVPAGDIGALVVKLPLPPGTFPTLWNAPERYQKAYFSHFPGYYETGDAGFIDGDGYVFVMSRTDDVINVAGHRLSTGAMEEVLSTHPAVAECAVTGVADDLKGQLPLGFLVLKSGVEQNPEAVVKECIQLVREQIGPVAAFKHAVVVPRLPKTRSGKVLRATMRKIADGEAYNTPATIDDPAILVEIQAVLAELGYGRPTA
ncbi:MAG: propionyl-CoA synthetase [Candidatus Competibacterales bacterium]